MVFPMAESPSPEVMARESSLIISPAWLAAMGGSRNRVAPLRRREVGGEGGGGGGFLVGKAEVARGRQGGVGRLQPVVHLDSPPRVVRDPRRLQVQAVHVGGPPAAAEGLVAAGAPRS